VVPDRVFATDIDESTRPGELSRQAAVRLARAKADAAADGEAFVLAADTVAAVGRRILPKAETAEQARACLTLLSGRRHRVLTAVVLTAGGRRAERVTETAVTFNRMTERQIAAYLDTGEWQGKAGGYAIQGFAAAHVRFISGSFSGVMGLPLFETAQLLRGLGWPMP
jgi:septum formation protein